MTSDSPATAARARPVDPRLLRYASASRGFFLTLGVIAAAQTVAIVAFAWLVTQAIIGVIDGAAPERITRVLTLLLGVVVIRALLIWAREAVAARAAARVESQLRDGLTEAIGRLGPEWLAGQNTSRLAMIAGRGLDALDAYFGRYLPQLVQTVVATPVIVAVMWWQDWISGLTVVLTIPLIPLFMVLIGLATRAVQRRQWATLQHLAARFSDTVRGLSTLKVFGRQYRAAASIEGVTDSYRRETIRVLRVSFISGFALELLASISVALIAVTIGFRLLDGSITLAAGLFVLLLAPEAYLPLRQVGVQFHAAAEGVAATDDVFGVLDAAEARRRDGPRADSTPAPPSPPLPRSDLLLSEMRVHRGDRELESVHLSARAGDIVLISGPSGAGKSSVLAALRGAAAFTGTATYGGADVRHLPPSTWLAWAGQQPGLIAGTVADNVTLGVPDAPAERVTRALDLACASDLPPTRVLGVQGAGLSGGQAQRVAVARAFFRHLSGVGPVIALDEPSAALDAETEQRLWASVRALAGAGATVLLVSHRPSAAEIATATVRMSAEGVAHEL